MKPHEIIKPEIPDLLHCGFPSTFEPVLESYPTPSPGHYAGAIPRAYNYRCKCCGASGPSTDTIDASGAAWNEIRRMMPSYRKKTRMREKYKESTNVHK